MCHRAAAIMQHVQWISRHCTWNLQSLLLQLCLWQRLVIYAAAPVSYSNCSCFMASQNTLRKKKSHPLRTLMKRKKVFHLLCSFFTCAVMPAWGGAPAAAKCADVYLNLCSPVHVLVLAASHTINSLFYGNSIRPSVCCIQIQVYGAGFSYFSR